MLQQLSKTEMYNLCETALWVIMDPWESQSKFIHTADPPVKILPGVSIDSWNKKWADKIADYLPKVRNWLVIGDLGYYDSDTKTDIPTPIDSRFRHLPILEHRYLRKNIICRYIPEGCTSIVYTGFHEQLCVLHRKWVGYHKINTQNDIHLDKYIALELTCHWPSPVEETRLGRQTQRRDPDYKYIRVLDDY
jgi:hypothetical protein